ncbi:MAG TPA: transcriptional regulator [Candidatus Cloacimonadota bacterium]|nr:transcriptional regulator [Candidatus Cloacimonadota bacterium]
MTLNEIKTLLDGEVLNLGPGLDALVPCAIASDMISDILMSCREPSLLLTGLTNNQVIRLSDMVDLVGIVFVRSKRPLDDIVEMARERNLPLIVTSKTLYTASGLLYNAGLRSSDI